MLHNRQHRRMNAWPSNYIMDWWLLYVSTPHVTHWFWLNTVPFTRHGLCTHARRQKDKQFTYYVVFCGVPGLLNLLDCPSSLIRFLSKTPPLLGFNVAGNRQTHRGLHVKYQIFSPNFNQIWNFWQIFHTSPNHQISRKPELIQTGTETDRQMGTKLIGAFRDYANVPNNPSMLALQLHKGLVYVKLAPSQHLDVAVCIPEGREKTCVFSNSTPDEAELKLLRLIQ
jgi:hypothetical protein